MTSLQSRANNRYPRQQGGLFGRGPSTVEGASPPARRPRSQSAPRVRPPIPNPTPAVLFSDRAGPVRASTRAGRGVRTMTVFDPSLHHSTSQMEQPAEEPWTYCETTPRATQTRMPTVLTPAIALNMGTVRMREGATRPLEASDEQPCTLTGTFEGTFTSSLSGSPIYHSPGSTVHFNTCGSDVSLSPDAGVLPCLLCDNPTRNIMSICEDRVCRTCLRVWWTNFPNMRARCPYCRELRDCIVDLSSPSPPLCQ